MQEVTAQMGNFLFMMNRKMNLLGKNMKLTSIKSLMNFYLVKNFFANIREGLLKQSPTEHVL